MQARAAVREAREHIKRLEREAAEEWVDSPLFMQRLAAGW